MSNQTRNYSVPVLEKAMRVLRLVARDPGEQLSVNALAKKLGISQATCYRIVRTLEESGWLMRRENGGYELGSALLGFVVSKSPHARLLEIAEPVIKRLAAAVGLTAKLTVRDGDEAVTVVRAEPNRPMVVTGTLGGRFHLCFGSSGAALAGQETAKALQRLCGRAPEEVWRHQTIDQFQRRVRSVARRGYAVDRGSFHPDVHSLSVPLAVGPRTLAAISVLAMPSDLPARRVPALADALRDAGEACADRLHASTPAAAQSEGKRPAMTPCSSDWLREDVAHVEA